MTRLPAAETKGVPGRANLLSFVRRTQSEKAPEHDVYPPQPDRVVKVQKGNPNPGVPLMPGSSLPRRTCWVLHLTHTPSASAGGSQLLLRTIRCHRYLANGNSLHDALKRTPLHTQREFRDFYVFKRYGLPQNASMAAVATSRSILIIIIVTSLGIPSTRVEVALLPPAAYPGYRGTRVPVPRYPCTRVPPGTQGTRVHVYRPKRPPARWRIDPN